MEHSRITFNAAAALSLVAALAHVWVMPEHFGEWWGYGLFFLSAAVAQGVYGLALLRRREPGRALLLLGVVGNLALIALYAVTRTAGVPFFGPHAGEVEGMGALDLAAVSAEAALVVALAVLSRSGRRTDAPTSVGGAELVRTGEPLLGVSRRDFLRTAGIAGALGVSGGALGLRAAGVTGA
ncbi:MAG: twin-arginine translocation signal domain-containing protein, partial [Actinomycetota bacterium]|nr:twin-arginine translocation signal domain-containing protein [Actinomycetota bacterium]